MRNRVAHRTIEDEDRDRLGRVSGRLERGQPHTAELDGVAVAERLERILRFRRAPEVNRRARLLLQLEMTGDEVRVKVREDDMSNRQPTFRRERQVLIDVTLRIDDGSGFRLLVANQIRRVREAIEIELVEDHSSSSLTS